MTQQTVLYPTSDSRTAAAGEVFAKYEPLQVGRWYAEMDDDGHAGVFYQCVDRVENLDGSVCYVMCDESEDSDPRYVCGRSATTEYWIAQLGKSAL